MPDEQNEGGNGNVNDGGQQQQQQEPQSQDSYICPECSKSFQKPQALGSHRLRAHGVQGSSKSAKSKAQRQRRQPQVQEPTNGDLTIDRDKLLAMVFPNGMPAKMGVISEVETWLDEADRLAHAK